MYSIARALRRPVAHPLASPFSQLQMELPKESNSRTVVVYTRPTARTMQLVPAPRLTPWSRHLPWSKQFNSRSRAVMHGKGTKERIVIIGSGWAGYKLVRNIDTERYDVVCVSPRNYFVMTPLLAASAVGTLEFRSIVEPVRKFHEPIEYHQARCDAIDFTSKTITCTSMLGTNSDPATASATSSARPAESVHVQGDVFTLAYDKLVIAPGAATNTFGVPGVKEHAHFLKDVTDARKIRSCVIDCFEKAMQPGITEEEQRRLLHFATVGGGPTGVELSAELHDLITEDLATVYPTLLPLVRMTLYDVAPRILGAFDADLAEFATKKFMRAGVQIRLGTQVRRVTETSLFVNDGEEVPYGLLVWATGITQTPLVRSLADRVQPDYRGTHRLCTDEYLRVKGKGGQPMRDVFALGDCAFIDGNELPPTAQVANQQAIHLSKQLNKFDESAVVPFSFRNRGSMAYIGGWKAIVDLPTDMHKPSGYSAWVLWRSAYLNLSVSWRNKCLIAMYWALAAVMGRDVSRIR
ncbi:hypothetical protein GGF31_004213 [Allomyces arbusculus]|nr:hypothetical protein GGF31_004213 [Allomyces arbusculus]